MEVEIIDDKTQRSALSARVDVLDRVKTLATVPGHEFATTEQVAAFYAVDNALIRSVLHHHRDEFNSTGYVVLKGQDLHRLYPSLQTHQPELEVPTTPYKPSRLAVWDRKAVLLLGMLLRDSEVAKTVRRYLLAAEEKVHELVTAEAGGAVEIRPDQFTIILDKVIGSVHDSNKTAQALVEQNNVLIRLLFGKPVEGDKAVKVFGAEDISRELGVPLRKGDKELRFGFDKRKIPWAGYFGKGGAEFLNRSEVIETYRRSAA